MRRLQPRHRAMLALLIAVVAFSFLRKLDGSEISDLIGESDWGLLALAAALTVVTLTLRGLRAVLVLNRAGYAIPGVTLAALAVRDHAFGTFTRRSAAETLAVYGVPARNATTLAIYERGIEFTTLVLLLGAVLLITLAPASIAAGVLLFSAASLLLVLVVVFRWMRMAAGFYSLASTLASRVLPTESVANALISPRLFAGTLALSLAVFAFEALQALLVLQALGLDSDLAEAWVILSIALITGTAALLPLSLGTQDAGAVWAFTIYGFGVNAAAAGALMLRLAITLPVLLCGGLALLLVGGPGASRGSADGTTAEPDVDGFFRSS